jgi:hypothetical protein
MPVFVGIGTHTPSECPGASRVMREAWQKVMGTVEQLQEKHQIRLIAGPLHLDPAHKIAAVLDAPNMEALLDFLVESRLAELQAMEIWRTTPLDTMFQQAREPLF